MCQSLDVQEKMDVALEGDIHILIWHRTHFQNILNPCRIYVRLEHKIENTHISTKHTSLLTLFLQDPVGCSS